VVGEKPITIQDCINVAKHNYKVEISPEAVGRIIKARSMVNELVERHEVVYGLTTGFGSLNTQVIEKGDVITLQQNLIRSHAIGLGKPIPTHIVRCMLLVRLICCCNGNSGVRIEVVNKLAEAINKNYIPMVPEKGTVGASGDLAPLSHMILGLMGEGKVLDPETKEYVEAKIVMKKLNFEPLILTEKEGLALNNGTQFITSHAIFAYDDALRAFNASNMIASMTMEALHCTHKAFNPLIHSVKPHKGQIHVAKEINSYILEEGGVPSKINLTHCENKVQDTYDIRCIPQVHGVVYDKLKFVEGIIETELNSANDNPLIFPDTHNVLSGGNFHGMYVGMVTDDIAYIMCILCNISERRLDHLLNPQLNKFLPEFLVEKPGLNSGWMITQYASAGITAENRQLANPASVHSLPTCNGYESVVSMGGYAARKAVQAVENTLEVLALELFAACQALDFTREKTTRRLEEIHRRVRESVPHINTDVYMKEYIDVIVDMLKNDKLIV
jgi:histidine ammonia-lyase